MVGGRACRVRRGRPASGTSALRSGVPGRGGGGGGRAGAGLAAWTPAGCPAPPGRLGRLSEPLPVRALFQAEGGNSGHRRLGREGAVRDGHLVAEHNHALSRPPIPPTDGVGWGLRLPLPWKYRSHRFAPGSAALPDDSSIADGVSRSPHSRNPPDGAEPAVDQVVDQALATSSGSRARRSRRSRPGWRAGRRGPGLH